MELSVREVAVLRGESVRAVRGQIARGEVPAVKRDGRWLVDRGRLPLTEGQRRTLRVKADSVREAVEQALPSRMAVRPGSAPGRSSISMPSA